MKKIIIAVTVVLILVFALCCYQVDNTESVIVTRMGKPVKVVEDSGIHLKVPFMDSTTAVTKRLMHYTSQPSQVITKDKKSILIDNYCQWKVSDPLQLYLSVRDEIGAARRLDDIIYSGLRVELAKHDLIEIINENRRTIMLNVTEVAKEKALEYGIEIIDIRIKRADLPQENEKNIFDRMITERERIAKQYRSEGQEEAQIIRSKTDMDVAIMLAEAEKQAEILRGQADAQAIDIYADAFNIDPNFYEFNKLVTFYKDNTNPMQIVITTDSKLFELLKE